VLTRENVLDAWAIERILNDTWAWASIPQDETQQIVRKALGLMWNSLIMTSTWPTFWLSRRQINVRTANPKTIMSKSRIESRLLSLSSLHSIVISRMFNSSKGLHFYPEYYTFGSDKCFFLEVSWKFRMLIQYEGQLPFKILCGIWLRGFPPLKFIQRPILVY
jgi:hypothetical protein